MYFTTFVPSLSFFYFHYLASPAGNLVSINLVHDFFLKLFWFITSSCKNYFILHITALVKNSTLLVSKTTWNNRLGVNYFTHSEITSVDNLKQFLSLVGKPKNMFEVGDFLR
jgi:hypothetical protein